MCAIIHIYISPNLHIIIIIINDRFYHYKPGNKSTGLVLHSSRCLVFIAAYLNASFGF